MISKRIRLVARLDIKNEFVIKGIHLEGLRKVGDPVEFAKKYYLEGIDEILLMDAVASLYERNNLFHILEKACREVFIPITIGGGIRSIGDIDQALKSGADKISLNTQAIKQPGLIKQAAEIYGSQCIVASVEAKRKKGHWEAYIDNGREETGKNVLEWVSELEQLGAGEILLTSVDQEGTKKGFDIELVHAVCERVQIPVIVSGGMGKAHHINDLIKGSNPDAVAMASVLHYNLIPVQELKEHLKSTGVNIR